MSIENAAEEVLTDEELAKLAPNSRPLDKIAFVAGSIPFFLSYENHRTTTIDGVTIVSSYIDYVAVGGAALALGCGAVSFALWFRRPGRSPMSKARAGAFAGVFLLGLVQLSRGFGLPQQIAQASTTQPESSSNLTAANIPAPATPPVSTKESVEKMLKKLYSDDGFTQFECPDLQDGAKSGSCTLSAPNGVSMKATATNVQGLEWKFTHASLLNSKTVSDSLLPSVGKSIKKKFPKALVAIDCGPNPLVAVEHHVECKVSADDKKKREGTLSIEVGTDDTKWTLRGI